MFCRNLQRVGENHVYTILSTSCLWYRKVDDTFAIISYDFGETLQQLNYIDESIEFTIEKASKGNPKSISGLHHRFK